MRNVKTNLNKFPSSLLEEAKKMLTDYPHKIEVETDHSITFTFYEETEITTTLVFNSEGNLINYTCNCGKFSLCKHVGAALLLIEERQNTKAVISYSDFKTRYSGSINSVASTIHVKKLLGDLLAAYEIKCIAECLVQAFFDISIKSRKNFFYSLFELFEFSKLPDEISELLTIFLTDLIVAYDDLVAFQKTSSIQIKLEKNDQIFLSFFRREIFGSKIVNNVYCSLLNKKIFPSNTYFSSFLNVETFLSESNGQEIKLDGLETLYNNRSFLNNNYPISIVDQHNLINDIVNSNNSFYYFKCLYEICPFFMITKLKLAEIYFLAISKNKDKILDCKAALKLISEFDNVHQFLTTLSKDPDFDYKFWKEYIETLVSPYSLHTNKSPKKIREELEDSTSDISIEDLCHLFDTNYPFNEFSDFFSNKKIVLAYPNDILDKEKEYMYLVKIIKKIEDLFFDISSLVNFFNTLPFETIKNLSKEIPVEHAEAMIKLNFLDRLDFKKLN